MKKKRFTHHLFSKYIRLSQGGSFAKSPFSKSSKSKRQSGQALLEYALLISMAAAISLGFMTTFNGILQKGIVSFNALLEKELQPGSFVGKDMWEN